MAKNQVQYQKGQSLIELFKDYGTEEQCVTALFHWKWHRAFTALSVVQQVIAR